MLQQSEVKIGGKIDLSWLFFFYCSWLFPPKVEVSDGKVKIRADRKSLTNVKRQKDMCKASAGNKNVLIIGGGPASVACAETLRQEGFQGNITIVTKDKYIPYDRIKLSKVRLLNMIHHYLLDVL